MTPVIGGGRQDGKCGGERVRAIATVRWAVGDEMGRAVGRPPRPPLKSGPSALFQPDGASSTTPDGATSQCTPSNQVRACGSGPIIPAATLAGPTYSPGASVQCTPWGKALDGCEGATWVVVCARLGP